MVDLFAYPAVLELQHLQAGQGTPFQAAEHAARDAGRLQDQGVQVRQRRQDGVQISSHVHLMGKDTSLASIKQLLAYTFLP